MSAPPSFQVAYPVRDPVERIDNKVEMSVSWSSSRDEYKPPTNFKTLKFPGSNSWHGEDPFSAEVLKDRSCQKHTIRSIVSKKTVSPAEPTEGTREFNTQV